MCHPGRPGPRSVSQDGSPGRLARHKHGVERVAFAGAVRVSAAFGGQREHLCASVVRLVAETASGRAGEIDVLVHVVGGAAVQQSAHGLRDLGDALDRAHVIVGRQDPQRGHIGAKELDLAMGQSLPVDADLVGSLEKWIVDVRDVLHVVHPQPGVAPHPLDEVERKVGRSMPEMCGVIGRDAAHIHAGGGAGCGGTERTGRSVEQPKGAAGSWQPGKRWGWPGAHLTNLSSGPP